MVLVHHTGHPIKPEAIEHVDIHVEAEVRQEEAQHFVVAVIEEPRVPQLMSAFSTFMEIEMIGAVEHVDAMAISGGPNVHDNVSPVNNILAGMRVHNIEKNSEAHLMRFVNQSLELLRRP